MAESGAKSPAEERADRFNSLRSRWNSLLSKVSLGYLSDELEDQTGTIEGLADTITRYRKRGYIYSRGWEAQAETLGKRWPERQRDAKRLIRSRSRGMKELGEEIDALCERSKLSSASLDRLENKIERFESRVEAVESDVRGTYDSLTDQVYALQTELTRVGTMLDAFDEATFKLFPDERGVAVCNAVWTDDRDEPKGVLLLTDGRIVFEQREKKAKKKVLFITTKSEMLKEKLWEAPIGAIDEIEIEDEKKGFLGMRNKEMLTLRFRERSRELPGDVTLQLKGVRNEDWQTLIKRVQNGEFEAERYDLHPVGGGAAGAPAGVAAPPPPTAPATPPAEIPTKCSNCGGQLPTVYKGMREIACDYCGTIVRF